MGCSFKHSHPQIHQEIHQEAKTSPLGQSHYFDSVQPVHLTYFLSLSSGGQTSNMVCCKTTHLLVPYSSMIFSYVSDFPMFLWFLSHFPVEIAISKAHAGDSTASTPVPSDGRGSLAELPMVRIDGPFESWNIWDFMTNTYVYIITSTSYIVMH